MGQKHIDRAIQVIADKTGGGDEGYCVLALLDGEGYPTASTLSLSKAGGIGELTFCVHADSNKVRRARQDRRASVCFSSTGHNITLVGTMEVLTDPQTKKDMWYDALGGMFAGVDDPAYCVLRFTTKRYTLFFTDDYETISGAV